MTSYSLPGISLTQEQIDIIESCPPPNHSKNINSSRNNNSNNHNNNKGKLVRITAAAGAGKTTTLLALALKAAELGHTEISYVTFTRAAAKDGKDRLQKALKKRKGDSANGVNLEARTLHSFALRRLDEEILVEEDDSDEETDATETLVDLAVPIKMVSESKLKQWLATKCDKAVQQFLGPCYDELERQHLGAADIAGRKILAKDRVLFYIFKSLVHFCHSKWSLSEYKSKRDATTKKSIWGRDYYPAKQFHKENGESMGFSRSHYDREDKIAFYAEQAAVLWKAAKRERIMTYDLGMKQAQLERRQVPGTLLLVDESQDMDACQVDWIARQQVEMGKHVYIVGDPAQSIYGFRGAKSEHLMFLESDCDKTLTESWRFGSEISHIANMVLFAKENSDQTKQDKIGRLTKWIPYRTKPGTEKEATVTLKPLTSQWKTMKVTVIARTNAALLLEALSAMGYSFTDEPKKKNGEDSYELMPQVASNNNVDAAEWPKIHLNGRGESSGLKMWRKTIKMIDAVAKLYILHMTSPGTTMKLDPKMFDEFSKLEMTWDSFTRKVQDEEMKKYITTISVVRMLKTKTMEAIEVFQEHVMNRDIPAEEADLILTTCHSAKGMEWNNVHLCSDFQELCVFKKIMDSSGSPQFKFGFEDWGDDVNLAYVACTRAKSMLYLPKSFTEVLKCFDSVYAFVNDQEMEGANMIKALTIPGLKATLNKVEVEIFNRQLVFPLKVEWGIGSEQTLLSAFIKFQNESGPDQ